MHLRQGEEAGLLLDNVTASCTGNEILAIAMLFTRIWVDSKITVNSLEYVLAIASFNAAPLRTVVRESLEQSLCLVLVLKDTPAKIFGQL